MPTYKTPDVYVEEISVFPPAVAEVETAIPAFIGYTQQAELNVARDLILFPYKIFSLKDFELYFGGPNADAITVSVSDDGNGGFTSTVTEPTLKYLMYFAVKMFFDNGGGQCYIISTGDYTSTVKWDDPNVGLKNGLDKLALEDEPTMIVVPDSVNLSTADYGNLVQAMLLQCETLGSRVAIFDLFQGGSDLQPADLSTNRGYFGNNYLSYGAAYYPFLKTSINFFISADESNVTVNYNATSAALGTFSGTGANANTAVYNFVKSDLSNNHFITMPPSGSVAGVYAATDTNRGVWKAPANVSLADVIQPVIKLDNAHQDNFNVDPQTGKSINAIRAFTGKGTLVWGARTLAGNDNEWRYVPVRRFFIMVEQSVKDSIYWAVFEPNDANTWVKVRGMIENYLTQKWREGALAGATTKDAFYVQCSLGTTMTSDDILNGIMNVEIGMAPVRPAEFIVLKFSQMMQVS